MNTKYYVFIFSFFGFYYQTHTLQFGDKREYDGLVAAFGHFNLDEYTDVLVLLNSCTNLKLYYGNSEEPFTPGANCSFETYITSAVPGDFDGDSCTDIMITLFHGRNSNDVKILWGKCESEYRYSFECKSNVSFSVKNQPIVVDFNGDMIPDVIGEENSVSSQRSVWTFHHNRTFLHHSLPNIDQSLKIPHSSGLIDTNRDMVSEILIMGEKNMELWYNVGKAFISKGHINYPDKNVSLILQSTFIDFNSDGIMDHIMPVCKDSSCRSSSILIWNDNASEWQTLFDDFLFENEVWGFKIPDDFSFDSTNIPVVLRSGDIDLDGYPDFIAVLESKTKSNVQVFILSNIPCDSVYYRCLNIKGNINGLADIPGIQFATFFDMYEDGILDILVSSVNNGKWKIHALKNMDPLDSCFMKVLVLSGLFKNCSHGVNIPGPVIRYNMTLYDGKPLVNTAIQMSQSAYFSLLLPYSLFGLGQTPNFIEDLTISIAQNPVRKKSWAQIIPNSQILVIPPSPSSEDEKWIKKLYVTPSHYVFLTCIALIGTCMFIFILVALLHWRERKEDRKEKMQDAYRFHFDAM